MMFSSHFEPNGTITSERCCVAIRGFSHVDIEGLPKLKKSKIQSFGIKPEQRTPGWYIVPSLVIPRVEPAAMLTVLAVAPVCEV